MKVYGIRTILGLLLIPIVLYLVSRDISGIWISLPLMSFFIIFLTPLIVIKDNMLSFIFINPFKKIKRYKLTEIKKIVVKAGYKDGSVTITTNTITTETEAWLATWELKMLYKKLISLKLNVESSGIEAIYWNP